MENYYEILRVSRTADGAALKAAYRRAALRLHPDRNPADRRQAEERFKQAGLAYRVLRDPTERLRYDLRLAAVANGTAPRPAAAGGSGPAAEDPEPAGNDHRSRVRRVLFVLTRGEGRRGIHLFEALERANGKDLREALPPRDYVDLHFLLGEAYERHGRPGRAVHCYDRALRRSRDGRILFYRPLVEERLYQAACAALGKTRAFEDARRAFDRAARLRLRVPQRSFLHKRMAEACLRLGERKAAADHLREGLGIRPAMAGVKKLRALLRV